EHQAGLFRAATADRGAEAEAAAKAVQSRGLPFGIVKRRVPEERSVAKDPEPVRGVDLTQKRLPGRLPLVMAEGLEKAVLLGLPYQLVDPFPGQFLSHQHLCCASPHRFRGRN